MRTKHGASAGNRRRIFAEFPFWGDIDDGISDRPNRFVFHHVEGMRLGSPLRRKLLWDSTGCLTLLVSETELDYLSQYFRMFRLWGHPLVSMGAGLQKNVRTRNKAESDRQ